MEGIPTTVKLESIKSLESTIRKLENAFSQMTQKGSNTTLVEKRLKAVTIGLAVLEQVWNQRVHDYTQQDLIEARDVINGLIPTVETSHAKSKEGSPQRTLLERRLKSVRLSCSSD